MTTVIKVYRPPEVHLQWRVHDQLIARNCFLSWEQVPGWVKIEMGQKRSQHFIGEWDRETASWTITEKTHARKW